MQLRQHLPGQGQERLRFSPQVNREGQPRHHIERVAEPVHQGPLAQTQHALERHVKKETHIIRPQQLIGPLLHPQPHLPLLILLLAPPLARHLLPLHEPALALALLPRTLHQEGLL